MQNQVLRHYDIRGKMYQEINPSDFYAIVRAALQFFKQQGQCHAVVVGQDGRVHSSEIAKFVHQACLDEGVKVYNVGMCSTPLVSFAQHELDVDAGFMITASHNPPEYNGLKLFRHKKSFCGQKLQQFYEFFYDFSCVEREKIQGVVVDASYLIDDYVACLAQEFSHLQGKDLHCFIDCGNGVAGPIVTKLVEAMKWQNVTLLYDEVDGAAPHHEADPTKYENVQDLHHAVMQNEDSFGIAFDGDVDRVAVVSQKGLLKGDELLSLFASCYLSEQDTFVCDIKSSSIVDKPVSSAVFSPTGCFNVIAMMEKQQAVLGGELSGHFFFKDGHPGYDDGIYGMMKFINMLYKQEKSCQDLIAELPQVYATGDIRIPCDDTQKHDIVERIKDNIACDTKWKITEIDGVRFASEKRWGLIRAANTQPMLSVCCQADTIEQLQDMKRVMYDLLKPYIAEKVLEQYLL